MSRVTSNPLRGDLFSGRLDAKINNAHTAFGRHSYDGSQAFGPGAATCRRVTERVSLQLDPRRHIGMAKPLRSHERAAPDAAQRLYASSSRAYHGLTDLTYPLHDKTITVTNCGRICFNGRKVNLSHVFAGQNVGVTQVGDRVWLVSFMQYDLGYFDDETCRLEPIENPFGPKVLPMSPE